MMTKGGKDVTKFTLPGGGITDAIGRQQRKLERTGNFDGGVIAGFLLPMKMPLQFHIDVVPIKNIHQPLDAGARFFEATVSESQGQWPVVITCKADKSGGVFAQ